MTPAFACGRSGKLYRYYVSSFLQQGQSRKINDRHPRRIAAAAIEGFVAHKLASISPTQSSLPEPAPTVFDIVVRLELQAGFIIATLPEHLCAAWRRPSQVDPQVRIEIADNQMRIHWPFEVAARGKRTTVLGSGPGHKRHDPHLIKALRTAHAMLVDAGKAAAPPTRYRRKLLRLALLAPDIQKRILEGQQPPALTLAKLLNARMPLSWHAQREWILSLS